MIKCQHLWDIPVAERAVTIANLSALLFILNEHTSGNLQALILRVHMSHNMVMFIRFKTTNRKFKEPRTTSKATTWKGPKLQNTFHFSTKVEHDHLPYIICKLSTRDLTTYNISISEIMLDLGTWRHTKTITYITISIDPNDNHVTLQFYRCRNSGVSPKADYGKNKILFCIRWTIYLGLFYFWGMIRTEQLWLKLLGTSLCSFS